MNELTCSNCGTANPSSAQICSSCGTALHPDRPAPQEPPQVAPSPWAAPAADAPPPPTPPSAGGTQGWSEWSGTPSFTPPPPTTWQPAAYPPPAEKKSRLVLVVTVVVAILVAGAAFYRFVLSKPSISFPDTIAGQPLIDPATADALEEQFRQQAGDAVGADVQIGLYGTLAQPAFMVFAFEADIPLNDTALTAMAAGMASSDVNADLAGSARETRGDTQYVCAPVSSQAFSGTLCLWNDGETTGILIGFDESAGGIDMAEEIHDAVVS